MKKKSDTLTQQLRDAVRASGLRQQELAVLTGIPQPSISKFLGGRVPSGTTIDKLAAAVGKRLT
jgi:transcriptional regulator with XRE-family HTH domain